MDFDVDGAKNEVWVMRDKKPSVPGVFGGKSFKFPKEWNDWQLEDDVNIVWLVTNPVSGKFVSIKYNHKEARDLSGKPWFSFSYKDAGIRRWHQSEEEPWPFEPTHSLGYRWPMSESLVGGQDIVFWAVGHLSHKWTAADEANPQWHPTGFNVWVHW